MISRSDLSIEEKDCVLRVSEFNTCCYCGGFLDSSGFAVPIIDDKWVDDSVRIYPSEREWKIPDGTTEIVWYNR